MKTIKHIPLGVVNISATPHKDDGSTYIELFEAIVNLEAIKVRADTFAYIAFCDKKTDESQNVYLTGEIHKFTEITGAWENVTKRKEATPEETRAIQIPSHLKPNPDSFRFFFFPKPHLLVFQIKGMKRSISHSQIQVLFDGLFSNREIKKRFPMVSVTIEQEPEKLQEILNLPQIDSIWIHLERPNPGDSYSEREKRHVEKLLENQGARSWDFGFSHAPGRSVHLNDQNTAFANVATSYGHVKAKGKNGNNKPVSLDTSDHPIVDSFKYNKKSAVRSWLEQMFLKAKQMADKISNRR